MNERPVTQDDIAEIQRAVASHGEALARLRKYAPPVAEIRARWCILAYEATGLTIMAAGAYFVWAPLAPVLIGGWMLAEVIVSRRKNKGK